jgi:hypothetical protein
VDSTPRAYRLKASNAAPPISTFPGAIPSANFEALPLVVDCPITKYPFSYRPFTHYLGAERGA